jgi:hypothetical protein
MREKVAGADAPGVTSASSLSDVVDFMQASGTEG